MSFLSGYGLITLIGFIVPAVAAVVIAIVLLDISKSLRKLIKKEEK